MGARILVVEDNQAVVDTLHDFLGNAGFFLTVAYSAASARLSLKENIPDICLLDLGLPDSQGFDFLMEVNKTYPDMPVIITTGRNTESERVLGLELGAEDYVAKPLSLRELQARIRVILRRRAALEKSLADKAVSSVSAQSVIPFYGYDFDRINRTLCRGDSVFVSFSEVEASTLNILIAAKGQPVSRDDILSARSGGQSASQDRCVDITITRLRNKLATVISGTVIETVYGKGYRVPSSLDAQIMRQAGE